MIFAHRRYAPEANVGKAFPSSPKNFISFGFSAVVTDALRRNTCLCVRNWPRF